MITEPGIYDISEDAYHADPCEPFSLSRGIAHLLVKANPKKARHAHPKLGGNPDIVPNKSMDAGSAVHSMMLGKGARVVPLLAVYGPKHERAGQPVTNYQTKAAEIERDDLRDAGHIPCLQHEYPILRACAEEGLAQIREHEDGQAFFAPGKSEAVVVWEEDGLLFRIMVDRLPDDPRASPYDVKATKLIAAPGSWDRRLQRIYAFQDAFYRRGLKKVRGIMPAPIMFPVVELDAPHCMAMHAAAPSLQSVAEQEVERAIRIWRECVREDRWRGYPPFTAWVEASNYQLNEAEEQALRDEIMEEAA